jgi:thioredoxin-dependent adenylylsulfate APS reductase
VGQTDIAASGRGDLARFDAASAEETVAWSLEEFGSKIAVVTAFQAEGVVLIDIARALGKQVRVITIDTGRLPPETYELIDQVRGRYDVDVEVVFPGSPMVESMVGRHGVNLFYRDSVLRELCCHVRKVLPLERALHGLDAWMTGLRRGQNDTRASAPRVGLDDKHDGIVKVSPLVDWTPDQVWEYVRAHKVPYSTLYDAGYTSIGCAPCTRAVAPGEHERAGRWWWETDGDKECGIHGESPGERLQQEIEWLTKR